MVRSTIVWPYMPPRRHHQCIGKVSRASVGGGGRFVVSPGIKTWWVEGINFAILQLFHHPSNPLSFDNNSKQMAYYLPSALLGLANTVGYSTVSYVGDEAGQ